MLVIYIAVEYVSLMEHISYSATFLIQTPKGYVDQLLCLETAVCARKIPTVRAPTKFNGVTR